MRNRLDELLESTPWDRLYMVYRRATDFPETARRIADGTADEALFWDLRNNIEHQDGVFQASPYMVETLIELLDCPRTDRVVVLSILKTVRDAVVFQTSKFARMEDPPIPLEEDLCPPFVSEDEEDMWMEDWGADESNWHYWQQQCFDAIEAGRERIESLSAVEGQVGTLARELFTAD